MTLERVCGEVGYPKTIRVDQGSEFVSRDLDLWAYAHNVTLDFSRPGKPTDNAFIEAFNSKVRSECLNAHWFMSLDDARSKLEDWRRYYNEERPHSGIGQMTPILLHNTDGASSPSQVKEAENSEPQVIQRLGAEHAHGKSIKNQFKYIERVCHRRRGTEREPSEKTTRAVINNKGTKP